MCVCLYVRMLFILPIDSGNRNIYVQRTRGLSRTNNYWFVESASAYIFLTVGARED